MKNAFITLIFLAAIFLVVTDGAKAQTRIQFGKGKSAATVTGSTGEFGTSYVVRAKAGQKITFKLSPARGVGIKVTAPDGRYYQSVLLDQKRGGTYVIGLDETADYTIFLGSTGRNPEAFTLTVAITKMTDI
ncbi:MAG TPA: hypothetical protein PKO33_13635 [Pyrinomonadaceae bacterium]|nr:hypothetical protein [Pyrinomonadaceae bacterium]